MTLLVDFNMMDRAGRVLAVVGPDQQSLLTVGSAVTLLDSEGNRSEGTVQKLRPPASGPGRVAHVLLATDSHAVVTRGSRPA